MKKTFPTGQKARKIRFSILISLFFLLLVAIPKNADACVFCLEHMGMDAAMFWTSDVMFSWRMNYSDIWIAGSQVQAGYSHVGGSQALLTQENTLQALVTKKWMLQVTEPFYYRWNWNANASGTGSPGYSAGLGNNNAGFVAEGSGRTVRWS